MQRFYNSIFLVFSFLIISCNSKKGNQLETKTKSFQKYLETTFHKKIGESFHYYFLVPSTQCHNCNFYNAEMLKPAVNKDLTVITGFPIFQFSNFQNVLEDTTGNLATLPLANYSSKLLLTEKGQIKDIVAVHDFYKQIDSLSKIIGTD